MESQNSAAMTTFCHQNVTISNHFLYFFYIANDCSLPKYIYLHGIILILTTFHEFGDVKDLSDVKYHIEDTVVVVTLYYRTGLLQLLVQLLVP